MDNLNHIVQFSKNGKLFAYIDDSGKLKIWDTETSQLKQEYVPNLHLSSPVTCLAWIETSEKVTKKSAKRLKPQEVQLYLALGTNKGSVALYSYASAKIDRNLSGDGHSDAVTAIFHDEGDALYTAGEDSRVIKWSLSQGKAIAAMKTGKDKPTALLVLEGERVVAASKQIKVWDFASGAVERQLTGHSSSVIRLDSFRHEEKTYLLSVSRADRILSLWCLESEEQNAVGSFAVDEAVVDVSLAVFDDRIKLLAVTRGGVVNYFAVEVAKIKPFKPTKKKVTVQIVSDAEKLVEPIPIVAASLHFAVNEGEISVAYGDRMFLRFETVALDLGQKENILTRQNPRQFKAAAQSAKTAVVTPHVEESSTVEYINAVSAATPRKGHKKTELPMERRLENLSLTSDRPQANNMARLLIQGLHSRDAHILRLVFQTTDEEAVQKTLKRLPPGYLAPLVAELSALMRMKTANVQVAIVWLRALVQVHASQLMALGRHQLQASFDVCLNIADGRIANLAPLSRLRGRLDLLVNQMKRTQGDDEEKFETKNLLVYQDESDLDVEEERPESSDEANWEESESELEEDEGEGAEEEMDVSN